MKAHNKQSTIDSQWLSAYRCLCTM